MYDDVVSTQKIPNLLNTTYHLVAFAHRFAVALTFGLTIGGQGKIQVAALLSINLCFILYFVATRPFISRIANASESALLICESCIVLLAAILLRTVSVPVQRAMVAFYFVHIVLSIVPEAAKGIIVCLQAIRKHSKKQR
jgi:hypothetical protein